MLGPEAPIVALGSLVGVLAARIASIGRRGSAVLSAAGEFSAISALFGGPLVAGMLLVEGGVAMGAALLPLLLPGLVAAAWRLGWRSRQALAGLGRFLQAFAQAPVGP